ncbi:hypothetical protein V1478_016038 [Vespula squamosa]|uniref:Uncharacterized protein n=1 Tax=Vespula squamosa TaxID=30214 RepID=A0ABD2A2N0_VESSQ
MSFASQIIFSALTSTPCTTIDDITKISSIFLTFVRNARTIPLISSFPYARIDFNEEFKRQETKRQTTDAFSVKLLVVASSLVNLRGKQVLTVRTGKTSPRNSNGMQLYVGASTGPKPSPDTRTLK